MKNKFLSKIEKVNGRNVWKWYDENFVREQIQRKRPGDFEVVLRKVDEDQKLRSLLENNYYWGVVIKILTSYGEDREYWHAFCKVKFILPKVAGTIIEAEYLSREKLFNIASYLTTTEMTTTEFEDLMSEIRGWASTSEWLLKIAGGFVFIPKPNECEVDLLGSYA